MSKKGTYLLIMIAATVFSWLLYNITTLQIVSTDGVKVTVRYKAGIFFGTKTFDFSGGLPSSITLANNWQIVPVAFSDQQKQIQLTTADGVVKKSLTI